ncbi:MAG: cysteine--tRNA ligase, partial [Melioribacteraceae bacterium]|nr:cysteine--tRNA ligase [Melioribacteraceae bacterium]
ESFAGYGKLSGKKIDELESGSRVEVNTEKENPFDFSLWKKAKENEPSWDSPWGKGRPGWHTECSAMSMKHFGETIDIHAGGNDLIFPHHENEIAQSEAVTGKQFARYWMHFGFLNMKEEKMSKSLGNFFTAREILENYSAETIRLFFSQTHYSGPLAFSEDLLKTSQSALIKVENFVDLIKENSATSGGDSETTFDFESYFRLFSDAMDNDFNTPQATAVIFDFIKAANKAINETEQVGKNFYSKVLEFLNKTAQNVLGIIDLEKVKMQKSLENDLVKLLLDVRQKARAEKNFALSDEIRDKLTELGIELKDSKEGTTFKIK